MLNLKVGKTYKLTDFYGVSYTGVIKSKRVESGTTHIYYMSWKTEGSNLNTGRYFHDSGQANKSVNIVFNYSHIAKCDEIFNAG